MRSSSSHPAPSPVSGTRIAATEREPISSTSTAAAATPRRGVRLVTASETSVKKTASRTPLARMRARVASQRPNESGP